MEMEAPFDGLLWKYVNVKPLLSNSLSKHKRSFWRKKKTLLISTWSPSSFLATNTAFTVQKKHPPPPPPPFPKWARIDYRYLKRKTFWGNECGFFKDSVHKYNVNTVILSVIASCINKQTRHENTASDTFRLISWHLFLIPGIFCIKRAKSTWIKNH